MEKTEGLKDPLMKRISCVSGVFPKATELLSARYTTQSLVGTRTTVMRWG
jgi:hypothetical protein